MNCKLSEDRRKNIIGKWKVTSDNKKFIWRFYSDKTTATLENIYLTQIFDRDVYISTWENEKIDTLRIYYNFDDPNSTQSRSISQSIRQLYNNPNKIDYYILSNECRRITLVNTKTLDTLQLKRKQYFYQ
ncbi:hypothetical protein [Emticicia sp. C21]|uniref:hypothetical protein n=1 Tax=Emticicia sp. C21 TaxID=2302915 RepID=UPI000E9719AD|nr:hypothetical protein [Emticicia sp. C21]RFS13919.1 hypothetical protein D0T08_24615 [Emticicia sp. C21]